MSVAQFAGIPVDFGGHWGTKIVPPLTLNHVQQLQARLKNFTGNVTDPEQVEVARLALYCALKRNYADITEEQVGDMLDLGNMMDAFEACMDVSGMKRKALAAGDAGAGSSTETGGAPENPPRGGS